MNGTFQFSDIFKSNFLNHTAGFNAFNAIIALSLAFILGLFIMWIYKKTYKGVIYSKSFNLSLLLMTLITTFIILAVTSNVVLSLGMVGALSIVRFRTAVKETMDISYLFLAISTGIVLGAGLFPLAIVGVIFIGGLLLLFSNYKSDAQPYILVVNLSTEVAEKQVLECVTKTVGKYIIKSKSISASSGIELTIELKLENATTLFINELHQIQDCDNVVLVSYNGDYMA